MFGKKELSATEERWKRALESTAPQTEVVMETPLEGSWILGTGYSKTWWHESSTEAPEWSQTLKRNMAPSPPLCPEVKAYNTIRRLERDGSQRLIYPARKPKSKRVRIFPLWRYSAHDSSCRTKWWVGGISFTRFPRRIGGVSISS